MIQTIAFIGATLTLTSVAFIFKYFGYHKATLLFRVVTMLSVAGIVSLCGLCSPTFNVPYWGIAVVSFFGIANWFLFIVELFAQQKIYSTYLEVPRQLMYMVGKDGRCKILNDKQAKIAHENGETIYIHAVARVTCNPESKQVDVRADMGMGKDSQGSATIQREPPKRPMLSEMMDPELINKLHELQDKIKKAKESK